ncbi:MAG TPA: hypothetical protein PKD56_00900 [Chitinophagales bacterium]|nr:hypothetical protein [Chitinophagales bacterium]
MKPAQEHIDRIKTAVERRFTSFVKRGKTPYLWKKNGSVCFETTDLARQP